MSGIDPQVLDKEDSEIEEYLHQLDALRRECEQIGNFLGAQECLNRMREVNLRQAKRLEALSRLANADARNAMSEDHTYELLTFNRMWDEKFAEFEGKAGEVISNLKASHMNDYANQEGQLRMQLMNKRPRFSKTVVELRAYLDKMVQQRKYLAAEEAKRKLAQLEKDELADFDKHLTSTFDHKCQGLKRQYINELRVVEKKIKSGRDELESQKKADLQRLLKRHQNAIKELDNDTQLHVAKTKKYLERQVTAIATDPVKMGADFRGIGAAIKSKAAAGLARGATTPRAVGRRGEASPSANQSRISAASPEDDRFMW